MNGGKKGPKHIEPLHLRGLSGAKVKDIMNKRPQTISPEISIDDLLERMRGQIEGFFLVVSKDQKLLGIVTESDVFQVLHPKVPQATIGSVFKEAMKIGASTVSEIMTKRPVTVTPDMTVTEALNLMAAHKLRRLPVVEGEKLVGFISLRDIIELYRFLK